MARDNERNDGEVSRAVHTDLKNIRKNERSIRRLKRITAVLIVIFVGLIIYVSYPLWLPKLEGIFDKPISTVYNDGKTEDGNFPIDLDDNVSAKIYAVKNNMLAADAHTLVFYDENGKERGSYSHDFSSPIVKTSGKRALVFDSGSESFKVYNKSGEIYSKTAEGSILSGSIGKDGTAAIITTDDKYLATMQVYNPEGKLIYRYNCTHRIMSVTVDSDGSGCYICTFASENGEIYSQIRRIEFDSETEIMLSDKLDCIAIDCVKNTSGNITVIGDVGIYTLNGDGQYVSSYEYSGDLESYALDKGCAAVVTSGKASSKKSSSALIIADADSQDSEAYREIQDVENVKTVKIADERVIVLTSAKAQAYAFSGTLAATVELDREYSDFVYINSALFLQGRQGVDKIGFEM